MRAAIPRLQQLHREARARERAAAWAIKFAAVEKQRDAAADLLRERYPALVDELVAIMEHVAQVDALVDQINASAPDGNARRLDRVEQHARGKLFAPDVNIASELRVPHLDRGNGPVYAWPPAPQQANPDAVAFAAAMQAPPPPGAPRSWEEIRAQEDKRREDDRRWVSEYYERQHREAENWHNAEARAAREALLRQGHPPAA